ncbi:unnamed protein product [Alopecurus aequalis]
MQAQTFRPSPPLPNMQRHGTGGAACGIAYHHSGGFGAAGMFLPQDYDPRTARAQDFASLSDVVAPYSYNGGDSDPAVGWSSPGVSQDTGCGNGDEKKTKRLASNRESARRSRVRKQRRLDELSSRAARLRAANQRLLVELNHVIAEHGRVARENAGLREQASELRKKLDGMGVDEEAELAAAEDTVTEERLEI